MALKRRFLVALLGLLCTAPDAGAQAAANADAQFGAAEGAQTGDRDPEEPEATRSKAADAEPGHPASARSELPAEESRQPADTQRVKPGEDAAVQPGKLTSEQPSGDVESATALPAGELVPPVPRGELRVPMPAGAEPPAQALRVRVLLTIDEAGNVADVALLEGAGEPWDSAVLEAARNFRFEPARLDGTPVAVEIPYEHHFLPAAPAPEEGGRRVAVLRGKVVEMGTLRPVPGALVEVRIGEDETFAVYSEADGSFVVEARPGQARVEVAVTGYRRFVVREELAEDEAIEVRYLVERDRYDPYETTVVGQAVRKEVTRTTLRDREIHQVPGTFGDPFRVIGALPGVTQIMSLISYPIVRGSNPGTTGILIDGIRVPQLFHYLAGPAVIHPNFIDRVDFYPGNFPVEYGGYSGGIVDGITRPAARDERTFDLGIDLTNTSLFLRQPVGGVTGTMAGRLGYPALVLDAVTDEATASYWDYQVRVDAGDRDENFTVFAFGSHDAAGPVDNPAISTFHRLDLRYRQRVGSGMDSYRLSLGTDWLGTETLGGRTYRIESRMQWTRPLSERVTFRSGIDLGWRRASLVMGSDGEEMDNSLAPAFDLASAGVWADLPLWLGPDLVLTPGLRLDAYESSPVRQASVDPRLLVRYRLWENELDSFWLKAGAGVYSQPPRFPIPIPGLEELSLDLGLGRSYQASLGGEYELKEGFSIDVTGFFTYMDPIFLELESMLAQVPDEEEEEPDGEDKDDDSSGIDRHLQLQGRAMGVELLLRKRGPGPLFGWISYTLSRTERHGPLGWKLYTYDRTHILNTVAGIQLPRNWGLAWRFQVQDGAPTVNGGRLPPFTRLDLRVDRRVVYREWMLDFYIDIINVMVSAEPVDNTETAPPIRYLLPSFGFRAVL